ncbi:MAG: hypothetical protein WA736_09445 [Candidatus Acidiferrum sp.]
MTKRLQLSLEFELKNDQGQRLVLIFLSQESLPKLCLGLTLLSEGLVESFLTTDQTGKTTIEFSIGRHLKIGQFAPSSPSSKTGYVELTPNGLAYLLHFFLKYYRDGAAEVDHIDLQMVGKDTGRNDTYITFRVSDFKSPVSLEGARARLQS